MFEKVLLPTDFSPHSHKVLGFVRDLQGVRHIILFHVIDATRLSLRGWEQGPDIENARIIMDEYSLVLRREEILADVSIDSGVHTITQGDIPKAIEQKARAENVSLIMMGARGKNTIQNILLGNVSSNVIRHAKVPVLLMRFPPGYRAGNGHPGLFSRILVPVDFSEPSRNAVAFLRQIPPAGKVVLLHVIDRGESEEEIRAAVDGAKEKLIPIEKDLADNGIAAESRVHVGYPPDEIVATADRDDMSLILMSPQGSGWTREVRALLLGSTTDAVIRRATRPVLIAAGRKPA